MWIYLSGKIQINSTDVSFAIMVSILIDFEKFYQPIYIANQQIRRRSWEVKFPHDKCRQQFGVSLKLLNVLLTFASVFLVTISQKLVSAKLIVSDDVTILFSVRTSLLTIDFTLLICFVKSTTQVNAYYGNSAIRNCNNNRQNIAFSLKLLSTLSSGQSENNAYVQLRLYELNCWN